MDDETRFRDRAITLAGVAGENVEIPSANPVNYHQAVDDPAVGFHADRQEHANTSVD